MSPRKAELELKRWNVKEVAQLHQLDGPGKDVHDVAQAFLLRTPGRTETAVCQRLWKLRREAGRYAQGVSSLPPSYFPPPPEPAHVDTREQAFRELEERALLAETTLRRIRNDIARLEAFYCTEADLHFAGQSELGAVEHAIDRLTQAMRHKYRLHYRPSARER